MFTKARIATPCPHVQRIFTLISQISEVGNCAVRNIHSPKKHKFHIRSILFKRINARNLATSFSDIQAILFLQEALGARCKVGSNALGNSPGTALQQCCLIFFLEMEMASRDYNDHQRRNRGQEQYGDRQSGQSDWGVSQSGGPRGQHNFQDQDYGQQSQSDFDNYGSRGRGNDFGSDYGSSRHGGPGSSVQGGYGGGQRYQNDRADWGRQQQAFDHGSDSRQYGNHVRSDQFSDQYGNRQTADRYGGGFYGDESRFSRGGMRDESNESQGRYDPDYQQWRNEQMRNLDNDYESWRADRYKKFSDEFNTWRSNRTQDKDKQQAGDGTKGKNQT